MMTNLMIQESIYLIENPNKFHVGLEVRFIIYEFLLFFLLSFLESQLQLALINQIYFNDKNPDDIFGPIHIDLAHQMIELQTIELPLLSSYSMFPPNFV